jgi:catechol 2,3-dioxygenase-like lactoylglutathione lyase family enzyme
MKRLIPALGLAVLLLPAASRAQLYPPNEAGVTFGQWGTIVRDVDNTKKFWVAMGGTPIKIDGTDVMKFHGVLVFLTPGTPTGGSVGTGVNHIGFGVPSVRNLFDKAKAADVPGVKIADIRKSGLNGQEITDVYTADDLEIEVTEEVGVAPYPRLPPDILIESNHMHMGVQGASREAMRAWYSKNFDFKLKMSGTELVGDVPGMGFMRYGFGKTDPVPTKGRALDRIGLEIKNLQAFCKKLEANGVKLDAPYSKSRHKSFASAELTDPWGVSIELTEGLNRF